MSLAVAFDLSRGCAVAAGIDEAFEFVADLPVSASLFPGLQRLEPLGDGVWRWEIAPAAAAPVRLRIVHASRYVADRAARRLQWTPVRGVGNAQVGGRWTLSPRPGGGTALTLRIDGSVELPWPALARPVVAPAVRGEFARLVGRYVERLAGRLGGAV